MTLHLALHIFFFIRIIFITRLTILVYILFCVRAVAPDRIRNILKEQDKTTI